MNMKSKFFIVILVLSGVVHSVLSQEKHKDILRKSSRKPRIKNIQAQQPIIDNYDDYYDETNNESPEEIDLNGTFRKDRRNII